MPPKSKKNQKHFDAEAAFKTLEKALNEDQAPLPEGMTKSQAQEALNKRKELEAMAQYYLQQQQQEAYNRQFRIPEYKNEFVEMANKDWFEAAPGKWVRYEQFNVEKTDMQAIIDLMTANLTEPYNIFTYEHFIVGFPDLCICAYGVESKTKPEELSGGKLIGCISSKVSTKKFSLHVRRPIYRGYIAMLAVDPSFRGAKLGSKLVLESMKIMKTKGCFVATLETPCHNERALGLYTSIGFVKTKYLCKYYMDRADAVRLVMPLYATTMEEAADAAEDDKKVTETCD